MKPGLFAYASILAFACTSPRPSPVTPEPHVAPSSETEDRESWRDAVPPPGEPAKFSYPAARVETLANGLSLYFIERPGAMVALSLVARGGSAGVEPPDSGLASFTVRLMTEGTKALSSLELAEAVESLGTSLAHGVDRDSSRLGLTVLREDFDRGLELLADVAQHPRFDPKEIARVRGEWLDGIEATRQDPSQLAARVGLRVLLGDRWGAPSDGTRAGINALERAELVRFHDRVFEPKNSALVVSGAVPFDVVRAAAEKWLGQWQGRAATAAAYFEPPQQPKEPRVYTVNRPGAVQTAVFLAHLLPARNVPGYEERLVLNDAFGGLFTSRLNHNLREEHGYTYGARSVVVATRSWGAFVVGTAVRTEVTAEALDEVFHELRRVRSVPFSAEELQRARADLIQTAGANLDHVADLTDRTEELFVHSLAPDYHAHFGELLRTLSDDVINRQSDWIHPDEAIVVLVGDLARFEEALTAHGYALSVIDPTMTL